MAEEIDEDEFFHEDYTTASEWEVFNHKLNEIFVNDFQLTDPEKTKSINCDLNTCDWKIVSKEICFANTLMTVKFYRAQTDSTSPCPYPNPFLTTSCDNPIPNYFLITTFIVVEPESESLVESQVRMLQSSALMAMEESKIEKIPVFVTDQRKFKNIYFGVSREDTKRRHLNAVHIGEVPTAFTYYDGFAIEFKNKIRGLQPSIHLASIQLSYVLKIGGEATSVSPDSSRFLLPYGVSSNPVREVLLKCSWYSVDDSCIIDSAQHTTLTPEKACDWSLSVQLETHIKPVYHLSKCMEEYLQLRNNVRTLQSTAANMDNFLNDDNIKLLFTYLFPPSNVNYYENIDEEFNQQYRNFGIKTAPSDSIVTRFSCILATYNNSMGDMTAVGSLWLFFTKELSRRFEKCLKIPGILTSTTTPDTRTCIFHQKLQLLNICIEKKKIEEGKIISDEDSDEDEFYDCPPEAEENGRHKQLDLMLLNYPSEPLYSPLTQELAPKTEDQLSSENLSEQTERILMSDMESFKAANPKGVFEDFIRWHSPKDWIDEDLSTRMKSPGNSWITMWEKANPVPAKKQKRLFDFNEEAVNIIKFFESRTIGQICDLTLSTLLHSILLKLEIEGDLSLEKKFKKIHEQLNYITNNVENSGNEWEAVVKELSEMDILINNAKKLTQKLSNCELDFCDILMLLNGKEVYIKGNKRDELKKQINADGKFVENIGIPFKKEFVLESKETSQFMRAILHEGLTLCGSFTENTDFC